MQDLFSNVVRSFYRGAVGKQMTFEELKLEAKKLPLLPGVYLMKDGEGYVIYVGKSKHLRNRVSSYFGSLKHVKPKVKRMVAAIDHFEWQLTDTELEALLLECKLIKQYKPLYNRLLKNDKKYRYIQVQVEASLGTIQAVYEKGKAGVYFGPYDQGVDLKIAVEALKDYFKLPHHCKERMDMEECLTYRLQRCIGACNKENKDKHQQALKETIDFLEGSNNSPLQFYETAMKSASEQLHFDKAVLYREIWYALKRLGYRQEAIALSLAQTRGMALLDCPKGGYKLYLLRGTTIIKSIYLEEAEQGYLEEQLIQFGERYLKTPFEKCLALDKGEIDQSLILYNYLMSQNTVCYRQISSLKDIKEASHDLITAKAIN